MRKNSISVVSLLLWIHVEFVNEEKTEYWIPDYNGQVIILHECKNIIYINYTHINGYCIILHVINKILPQQKEQVA